MDNTWKTRSTDTGFAAHTQLLQQPQEEKETNYTQRPQEQNEPKPTHTNTSFNTINNASLHLLVDRFCSDTNPTISNDIIEMIVMYSWALMLSDHSRDCIDATDLIASIINEYLTDTKNTCEFNDDLTEDVLKYIYVRGGALRDIFVLREMKDIDIVIDLHGLSKQYLSHLRQYHSNSMQTKCIFYRHFQNQFTDDDFINLHPMLKHDANKARTTHGTYNQFSLNDNGRSENDAEKIHNFGVKISNCNWVLNSRFFLNIFLQSDLQQIIRQIEFRQVNWFLELQTDDGRVSFDFVDSCGLGYGQFQTLKQYQNSFGLFKTDALTQEIDRYYDYYRMQSDESICIPIHPTPMTNLFYDFTINQLHINLHSILQNKNGNDQLDFDWVTKMRSQNKIINEFNVVGINDLNAKILRHPCLDVLKSCRYTAKYYFWRLVKICAKWITQIENNIWKIDESYLKCTIDSYEIWFEHIINDFQLARKFITKFLRWSIKNDADIIDRLRVFRYIKFEEKLKQLLVKYPSLIISVKVASVPILDANNKIIQAPFLDIIGNTAEMWFWQLVETVIKCVVFENELWKIDDKYLKSTISFYNSWFDDNYASNFESANAFIDTFLGRQKRYNNSELIDTLVAFGYIKFEERFKKLLVQYPELIKKIDAVSLPTIDKYTKTIRAPYIELSNECLFWQLVKTLQQYTNEIENKIWTIDDEYLQFTIQNYSWFDDNYASNFESANEFIDTFLGLQKQQLRPGNSVIINTLIAFRHIKFEERFKKLLVQYPELIKKIEVTYIPTIDTDTKSIRAPFLQISEISNELLFWHLVKTSQEYIFGIQNKIWTIDDKYLQFTIQNYKSWVDKYFVNGSANSFMYKVFNWNINNQQDIVRRLHVFRYIGFDKHFRELLIQHPQSIESEINNVYQCLKDNVQILIYKPSKMQKDYTDIDRLLTEYHLAKKICKSKFHRFYTGNCKNNYFFMEDNSKLSEKIKKKWNKSHRRKEKMYYKKKNDKKQKAKSISKRKKNMLCVYNKIKSVANAKDC